MKILAQRRFLCFALTMLIFIPLFLKATSNISSTYESEEIFVPSSYVQVAGAWSSPQEAYTSNDGYAYTGTNNSEIEYAGYGINIPSAATSIQVYVGIESYTSNDLNDDLFVKIYNGSFWSSEFQATDKSADDDVVEWLDFTSSFSWTPSQTNVIKVRLRAIIGTTGCYLNNTYILGKDAFGNWTLKPPQNLTIGDTLYVWVPGKGAQLSKVSVIEVHEGNWTIYDIWGGNLTLKYKLDSKTYEVEWKSHITVTSEHPFLVNIPIDDPYINFTSQIMNASEIYRRWSNGEELWQGHLWYNETIKQFPITFVNKTTYSGKVYNVRVENEKAMLFAKTLTEEELEFLESIGYTLEKQCELGPPFLQIIVKTYYVDWVAVKIIYTGPDLEEEFVDWSYYDLLFSSDGYHSNFTAEKYADGIYDTIKEENYPITTTEFFDSFEDQTFNKWDDNGLTNWGITSDEEAGTAYHETYMAWSDNPKYGDLISDNINLTYASSASFECWIYKDDIETGEFLLYFYNGTAYNLVVDFYTIGADDTWLQYTTTIDSSYFVSNFRIKFWTGPLATATENVFVDYVKVTKTTPNYKLDLSIEWLYTNYTRDKEELCIYVGAAGSETLQVDVWYANAWQTVITNLVTGWNNVSVSAYLNSSTFKIRFKATIETGDTVQDSWQIDASLLHVWNVDTTPPIILIHSPGNLTYTDSSILVNITVVDDVAVDKVWYNVKNETIWVFTVNITYTEATTMTGFTNGSYNFYAWANDTSGNTAQNSTVWFTVAIPPLTPEVTHFGLIAAVTIIFFIMTGIILKQKRWP